MSQDMDKEYISAVLENRNNLLNKKVLRFNPRGVILSISQSCPHQLLRHQQHLVPPVVSRKKILRDD